MTREFTIVIERDSEGFFVAPEDTRREHPQLYERLAAFYGQDPATERSAPRQRH